jgi:hypothetical protein
MKINLKIEADYQDDIDIELHEDEDKLFTLIMMFYNKHKAREAKIEALERKIRELEMDKGKNSDYKHLIEFK